MADTKIEWATKVWNPITGCTPAPVAPGCRNCYARRMANRLAGRFGYPADDPFRVTFHPDRLDAPKKWFRERVFVNSMGDLFLATREQIDAVFSAMYHDRGENIFIILTKQPAAAARYVAGMWDRDKAPMPRGDYGRIVIGTSVSDQPTADRFIPEILQIERFTLAVSVEPMLGPVDLTQFYRGGIVIKPLCGLEWTPTGKGNMVANKASRIDWVICGGETGPGARPMHPDWPRSLRDQCQEAGVPFFFKQWGEWRPDDFATVLPSGATPPRKWVHVVTGEAFDYSYPTNTKQMMRVGKKAAGCLLDGREWKEFPGWPSRYPPPT